MSNIDVNIVARGIRFVAVFTYYDNGNLTKDEARRLLQLPLFPGGDPVDDSHVLDLDKDQRGEWYTNLHKDDRQERLG